MTFHPSRRNFLQGLGVVSVMGLAGCTALAPKQRLMITVFNNTKARHILELTVVDGDDTLVQQYIELPAGIRNYSPEVQTVVSLGKVSKGKRVNVRAVVDGKESSVTDAPLILDCESEYKGNAVTARVQEGDTIHLSNDLDANHCFTETETVSDDSDWLNNETES
ncbi:twin-arginine translocation signal domain-containing protein [Haloarcula nitratireducens]|uniref:Twin-arginine translocation signal domain-containing protein n=1 Tax=Haloarcula nitratireducens TaxID=2487749 RepID=A0AAW4PI53_9EURY|nr:twin-arginine translocation signal domain-containing protein [Halomicroarcula nitratireducens]MBX0297705.1 twin-arginine translocation signal domain-containing protein [Halomicroarcula nitratireducens]